MQVIALPLRESASDNACDLAGVTNKGIVSYAQNFEDIMLWRAVGHVEHGCYIDIGAQHPIIDSVSKAFYEHGWRGIHVEPVASYADIMRRDRPDELVLQAAIAEQQGLLRFFEIPDTGLSTASPGVAEDHRLKGYSIFENTVTALTMDALLDSVQSHDIHWLKIDVEGFEKQVLSGWKTSNHRPWIIVIESTAPNSQADTHEAWEPLVIDKGYMLVYMDGLNRYYISSAHVELKGAFRFGPCVFDKFELSESAWPVRGLRLHYEERLADITRQKSEISASHQEVQQSREQALVRITEIEAAREEVQRSLEQAQARITEVEADLGEQREARIASELRITELYRQVEAAQGLESALRAELAQQCHQATLAAAQIAQMQHTFSWRLTSPLRRLGRLFLGNNIRRANQFSPKNTLAEHSISSEQDSPIAVVGSVAPLNFEYQLNNQIPNNMRAIQHVDQLLELHGSVFLTGVYQTLLGRPPDKGGERFYLGRLRAGYSKQSVIVQISKSREAKARKAELPGLEQLVAGQKRANYWLWKILFRGGRVEQKINQLEYQIGCMANQLTMVARQGNATAESINPSEQGLRVNSLPLTSHAQEILSRLSQAGVRSTDARSA